MIAVPIGPDWRLVAVAAPAYFPAIRCQQHPQELVGHACINIRQATAGGLYAWEFERDGREVRVRVDGQLTFNTSMAMIDAALPATASPTCPRTSSPAMSLQGG